MEEGEEGGLMGRYNDEDEKPVVEVELAGPSGNTVQILANAREALRKVGRKEDAEEMVKRFWEAKGYEEALKVIGEYVELRKW